jgi:hypothetical protein
MNNENDCSFEGDLWALGINKDNLGCIIYQLYHNSVPFSGSNNILIMKNILDNKMNPIEKVLFLLRRM